MVLAIKDLSIRFPLSDGSGYQVVVDTLSLSLAQGEIMGLVGESGSGKSMTALAIMQLLPQSARMSGEIEFEGEALHQKTERQMRKIRGARIAMIFQEPMTALNPLHTIGKQLSESLEVHQVLKKGESVNNKIKQLLNEVGLEKLSDRLNAYPHQLSGGERQRVMIAMALACEPELLIADEPTTAVDVTLQAKILDLLKEIQKARNLSILFITHDLHIVERIADNVAVLRKGKLIEFSEKKAFFKKPSHEYSQKLLDSRPKGTASPPPSNGKLLLEANDVSVRFPMESNFYGKTIAWIHAVKGAGLKLKQGHALGIVGESGSGKTTLAMALLQLQAYQGRVVFQGKAIDELNKEQKKLLRSNLQIVFQDPFSSLNPRMTIEQIIGEGLKVHEPELANSKVKHRVSSLLKELDLDDSMLNRYPHEFSGGQRQRISIARALVLEPELIVMDEPTSALDVTVQAQIIDLLKKIQDKTGVSYLFISHDLEVIRALCHEIIVMRSGEIVEQGDTEALFKNPKHGYTQMLMNASIRAA